MQALIGLIANVLVLGIMAGAFVLTGTQENVAYLFVYGPALSLAVGLIARKLIEMTRVPPPAPKLKPRQPDAQLTDLETLRRAGLTEER
jgi:hypothetical protein